jgi:hypothetical protein
MESSSVTPTAYVEPVRRRAYVYRESSDSCHLLYDALAAAQGKIGTIPKRHRSHFGAYADLADIREFTHKALAEAGLAVHQTLQLVSNDLVLVTTLGHRSGQWISSVCPIKAAANPQQTAAAVTYARRMAFSGILCLATEEEDDGETAAVAAASSGTGSPTLFTRAMSAVQSCTTKKDLREKIEKAHKLSEEGQFDSHQLEQLMAAADAVAKRLGDKANVE